MAHGTVNEIDEMVKGLMAHTRVTAVVIHNKDGVVIRVDSKGDTMSNERAVRVIRRVENKLTGREFGEELSIAQQVQRLIEQATSHLNLCQCYVGWCPFW